MQLTHSFSVPASIDVAWNTFMDLQQVGECFPGATVTEVSGDSFTGQVKVKLGPIAMVYAGTGQFTERDEASHHAVIKAEGKDKRGNGTAGATATIQLHPEGDESTTVDVSTDLLVTGKPAQFGRGVMQDVSDKLLGRFVQCIEGRLTADGSASGGSSPRPSSSRANMESGVSSRLPARAGGAGSPVASGAIQPAGTAAMFGATAGADSWESRFAAGKGSSARSVATTTQSFGRTPSPIRRPPESPASGSDDGDHIDLGATVLPVLIKGYGKQIGVGLAGFLIGWKLGRLLPG